MKLTSGEMLWTNINKIPNKYTYLSDNINCDVAIIGCGITGAIASYYLTKAGVNDVVVVDKNIIGYGSTKASTSILQYEIDTDLYGLKGMIGEENAVKCFKMCEKAVYDIEKIVNTFDDNCGFSLRECFYYANKQSHVHPLVKEYNLRKKHGFNVDFLSEEQSKEKFSFPVKCGIYSNSGAGQINPYKFTHNLISKSVENGAQIYENTEVIEILPQDNCVILKTKNNFKINAKKIIITTGYEGKKYIKENILNLYRSFTIVTKPVKNFDGWHKQCIIRDNNSTYNYLRTTDNRIIIGGEDEKIGGMYSKVSNLNNEDTLSIQKYDILLNKLKSYFPNIKDIEIEYKFSGLFGLTKDGLPYIGEYQNMPNCYFLLGYGSNGILYSIMGAQLIRDLYLKNDKGDLNLFKFDR